MSFFHSIIFKIVRKIKTIYVNQVYQEYRRLYNIDDTFRFNGEKILFGGKGKIICKANSYIGDNSSISSNEGYFVEIGKNCAISHNVKFYNNSYISDADFNKEKRPTKYGNITIGDGVWIGANVLILPGVIIGKNTVIGANSVVRTDMPENSIASGIPCKVIRPKRINVD